MTLPIEYVPDPSPCGLPGELGACQGLPDHVLAVTCVNGHRQTLGACYFHGHHPPAAGLGFCTDCGCPLLLTERKPCPEGFHWIGQPFTSCDQCGLPAWDHDGMADFVPTSPVDMAAKPILRPWKPGEREAVRAKWQPTPVGGE